MDVDAILADLAAGTSVIPRQTTDMNPAMPVGSPLGESLLRGGKQALLDFCAEAPPWLRRLVSMSPSQAAQSALPGLPILIPRRIHTTAWVIVVTTISKEHDRCDDDHQRTGPGPCPVGL